MTAPARTARTRTASGRFAVLVLLTGCQVVSTGAGGPTPSGGPDPTQTDDPSALPVELGPVVVEPGDLSGSERSRAEDLWASARRSFEARRFFEVLRTTEVILGDFAASDVSGEALRLSARAEFELGRMNRADQAAGRYVSLLERGDPRGAEMRLLQAEATSADPAERLDRLLRVDEGASPAELQRAAPLVRDAAAALRFDELRRVVDTVGSDAGPLAPLAEAPLAVTLLELGRDGDAAVYARRAIEGGATDQELEWAEGVLRGELPEGRGRVTAFSIGLVLPFGGPPALSEFAALVREGVEVAAATVLGEEYSVTVLVRDDEGDPIRTAEAITELEGEGVAGVIGMLQDDVLVSAGAARSALVPLVSPTARSAARAGEGVYSLEGSDPQAAAAVARYAVSRAFQRIAFVLPDTPEASVEADAFERVAEALGMPVAGRFAYQAGATFFEPQIRAARNALRGRELDSLGLTPDDTLHMEVLEPTAIFLPIPPEDVEFLAPQLIHFGLDTLAIELLGTSGWTDPQILAAVDPRHTTGVVATAPTRSVAGTAGDLRFREAYEETFQRTLVGATPAVGYDAGLLLLEALRPGRIDPAEVNRAMARLEDVEGATGVFSVVDGRVVRETRVVRVQDRVPVPEPAGWPDSLGVPDALGGSWLAPRSAATPDSIVPPDSTLLPTDSPFRPDSGTVPPDTLLVRPDTGLVSTIAPVAPRRRHAPLTPTSPRR